MISKVKKDQINSMDPLHLELGKACEEKIATWYMFVGANYFPHDW